jgi:hypothetical protein
VYGGSEVKGTSNQIMLQHDTIALADGNQSLGLYANGNDWVIQDSTIDNTGLSGMLLNGDRYQIIANTITHTGLDTTNGYNNHGIYLDAADATIQANTITNFAESAISVRYHGSSITNNQIAGGRIGIDYFQTDPTAGNAHWTNNTITATTDAGIYVSGSGAAGNTAENFTITANTIHPTAGHALDVHHTSGICADSGNRIS